MGSEDSRLGTWVRGKYHLDRPLGDGGMAVVYSATHRNKKRFAVKMLRPELSTVSDVRNRFLREGYVANTVDHPGVVAVLDDDVTEDGCAFLVMELLDGDSVDRIADREGTKLGIEPVLVIAHELLDVLVAAHAKSVVHRDLKPANLFVTRSGQLKVLDFGIARIRDAHLTNATHTGMAMGTPAFMGPEQARGKSSQIGPKTDLWSVGATMFSLLTGENVHAGETAQEVVFHAGSTPARSLATALPDAPPSVVEVVDRALAFEQADRWESASAMRDAIAKAYEELFAKPISTEPIAALTRDRVRITASLPHLDATGGGENAPTLAMPDASARKPAAAVGHTTAQPVSTGQVVAGGSKKRTLLIALGGLGAVGVVATAIAVASSSHPTSVSSASAIAEPTAPKTSAGATAVLSATTQPTATAASASAVATVSAPPVVTPRAKPIASTRQRNSDFDRR